MQRILVVEDDAAITRHLCPLLRSEGFEVEAAGSFEQARWAIEGNPPDLALVDLALPDGHGFALCPLLGPPLDVPVIFLTAAGDEASVVAGLGLGAAGLCWAPRSAPASPPARLAPPRALPLLQNSRLRTRRVISVSYG